MPRTSKTPAGEAGASRDSFGGPSRALPTLQAYQVQFLTMAHAVRPEVASMLAALAFGGGAQ
jgi:hypothetical protein